VFSVPPLTPTVKKLIAGLLIAFVVELIAENVLHVPWIRLLALDTGRLGPLTVVQLVTYVLVEGPNVASMLFGLFFMWLILSPFEVTFGARHTVELIAVGTVVSAIVTLIVGLIAPIPGYVLLGSSTIAYAGIAAMTQVIRSGKILLLGVLPMTGQQLLLAMVGISFLVFLASPAHDYLTLVSSLSAMGAGIGYVRYMARAPRPPKRKSSSPPRFRVLRGGGGSSRDDDSDRPKWLN
jgi:membrane associated rhomboid family serine protease